MVVRAGGEKNRQQETIDMEEDGGREGGQVKTRVSMQTERDSGEEEDSFTLKLILIITSTMEDPRTWAKNHLDIIHAATEGDTS